MPTLLELHSSLNGDQSVSSKLVRDFVTAWREQNADGRVISRDLAADPLPHLDGDRFGAFGTAPDERTDEQAADVETSDELIGELKAADVVVLGVPMYNFTVPSTFKAWMDHVARAGVTFRYTQDGPEGLLQGKRAVVISARGGRYAGTDKDTHTRLLQIYLGFLGFEDVEFVYAEGVASGDDALSDALDGARERLRDLLGVENAA